MAFKPIVLCHCNSTKPKNHTNTSSITFTQQNTLCAYNKLCAWAADKFPPLTMGFHLLYCNITSLTSPKSPWDFCLLLAFCKMEFCFYVEK